jgi:quinol monooxygenase YgiN
MKRMTYFTAITVLLTLTQCKPAETKVEEPLPAASFNAIVVDHPVRDFNVFKPVYDGHDSLRLAYGVHNFVMGRGLEDTNRVLVINKIDDVAKAKEFAASPDLKSAMEQAGIAGPPTIAFINVVRNDTAKTDIKERLMVSHHVKDYDAWLKVYDAEGRTVRAENGLVDRGLARGIDDPNMVYVVFAVTDMEKAKTRASSEDLKKLMTDAGVDGPPNMIWYRLLN